MKLYLSVPDLKLEITAECDDPLELLNLTSQLLLVLKEKYENTFAVIKKWGSQ